jgi:hypothetical protein
MATSPPVGFRGIIPGSGFEFGVDGGAISGVQEVVSNSISGTCLALNLVQTAIISLTAAQIKAMYATPILLVAAPSVATQSIIVDNWTFTFTYVTPAFTSGGAVNIQYGSTGSGGGTAIGNTLPAAVLTATSNSETLIVQGSSNITLSQGTALYLTNASAAFATGTASSAVITLSYYIA